MTGLASSADVDDAAALPPGIPLRGAPTWSDLGPELGGRLDAIEVGRDDPSQILVGSPGGGVWRSEDGGQSWQPTLRAGLPDSSIVHLEWDSLDPTRLYAAAWNGLYASLDRGDSWVALVHGDGSPARAHPSSTKVIDPRPFAQATFGPDDVGVFWGEPCNGIWHSGDGVTFRQDLIIPGDPDDPDNCVATIAADAFTRHVYIATHVNDRFPAHVFRSLDPWVPGQPIDWIEARIGLPIAGHITALATGSGFNSGVRIAGLRPIGSTTELWRLRPRVSPSWELVGSYVPSTMGHVSQPRTLVHSAGYLFAGDLLPFHSADFGASWSRFSIPGIHIDTRAIVADPGLRRVWAVNDGSLWDDSQVNGASWLWDPGSLPDETDAQPFGTSGLRVWQTYFVTVVPPTSATEPRRRVFVGSIDNGGVCSDDGGASWRPSPALLAFDVWAFRLASSDPNRGYAIAGGNLYRTDEIQRTAQCVTVATREIVVPGRYVQQPGGSNNRIAIHPHRPDRFYIAMGEFVAMSNDGGRSFFRFDLPVADVHTTAITVDALGGVWVGTGALSADTPGRGVFFSRNGGRSFEPYALNDAPPETAWAIETSGVVRPTVWMATTSGLYRRRFVDTAPERVLGGDGIIVSAIEVDPRCPTRVYAGLGFGELQARHGGGVVFSDREGAPGSWRTLTAGTAIHGTPITDLQIDPVLSRHLFVATYGRGAWRYDWGAILPACRAREP